MKFATVVTNPGGYLETLEESCKRNNIKLDKIGWGMEWRGWRWRTEKLLEYLKECDPDEVVCFFDGYDVIVLGGEDEIMSKFRSMNCDILLSTEQKSHYVYRFASWYQNGGKCDKKYLNGGCYMGNAKSLIKLLDRSIWYYNQGYNDDQEILTKICKSGFSEIDNVVVKYDYSKIYYNHLCDTEHLIGIITAYIFGNDVFCKDLVIDNGRIIVDKKYRPSIVHFPGKFNINSRLEMLKLPIPVAERKRGSNIMHILGLLLIIYNLAVRNFNKPIPIDTSYDVIIPFAMSLIHYMDNKRKHPECFENGGKLNWLGVVLRIFHIFTGFFITNLSIKNIISPVVWKEYLFMLFYILLVHYLVVSFNRCILTILEYKLLRTPPACTAFGKLDGRNRIALEQGFVSPEFLYGNRGSLLIMLMISVKLYLSK